LILIWLLVEALTLSARENDALWHGIQMIWIQRAIRREGAQLCTRLPSVRAIVKMMHQATTGSNDRYAVANQISRQRTLRKFHRQQIGRGAATNEATKAIHSLKIILQSIFQSMIHPSAVLGVERH